MYMTYLFFFFKQKTAYEMRISDWSSDVCSSDLSNSIVSASEWPTNTGTRTHVACTLILGSRIFLVSATIFHSSLVEPSSRNESMCGMTLKAIRSEEHTSELQSLMRISYAVFCLKKKNTKLTTDNKLTQYDTHDTPLIHSIETNK